MKKFLASAKGLCTMITLTFATLLILSIVLGITELHAFLGCCVIIFGMLIPACEGPKKMPRGMPPSYYKHDEELGPFCSCADCDPMMHEWWRKRGY